jgi:hypothetical protein
MKKSPDQQEPRKSVDYSIFESHPDREAWKSLAISVLGHIPVLKRTRRFVGKQQDRYNFANPANRYWYESAEKAMGDNYDRAATGVVDFCLEISDRLEKVLDGGGSSKSTSLPIGTLDLDHLRKSDADGDHETSTEAFYEMLHEFRAEAQAILDQLELDRDFPKADRLLKDVIAKYQQIVTKNHNDFIVLAIRKYPASSEQVFRKQRKFVSDAIPKNPQLVRLDNLHAYPIVRPGWFFEEAGNYVRAQFNAMAANEPTLPAPAQKWYALQAIQHLTSHMSHLDHFLFPAEVSLFPVDRIRALNELVSIAGLDEWPGARAGFFTESLDSKILAIREYVDPAVVNI